MTKIITENKYLNFLNAKRYYKPFLNRYIKKKI